MARLLPLLLALAGLLSPPGGHTTSPQGDDVLVLATQRVPKVERILDALQQRLGTEARIRVYDMEGRQRRGERLVGEIDEAPAHLPVICLGSPAAELASDRLQGRVLLTALVGGRMQHQLRANGSTVVASAPGPEHLLGALKTLWPDTRRVGIVVAAGEEAPWADHPAAFGTADVELVAVPVASGEPVVSALQRHRHAVDGFLFQRTGSVLNRRTLDAVVDWLHAERLPAVGYSRFLVQAGLPAATVRDAGDIADQLVVLLGREVGAASGNRAQTLYLNRRFADLVGVDRDALPAATQVL